MTCTATIIASQWAMLHIPGPISVVWVGVGGRSTIKFWGFRRPHLVRVGCVKLHMRRRVAVWAAYIVINSPTYPKVLLAIP